MVKILIVDDEIISRETMCDIFSKYGHCTSFEKGIEAFKAYQEAVKNKEPYDLIILDYSLEDVKGLNILKEIRDDEKEKKISPKDRSKIIMVTSHSEMSIVQECITAGCDSYILKPLEPAIVKEKLLELGI